MVQWFSETLKALNNIEHEWCQRTQQALIALENDYSWIQVAIQLRTSKSLFFDGITTDVYVDGHILFNDDALTWMSRYYPKDIVRSLYDDMTGERISFSQLSMHDVIHGDWVNHSIQQHQQDPLALLLHKYGILTQEWLLIFEQMRCKDVVISSTSIEKAG